MPVYLAWVSAEPTTPAGPWRELRPVAPGVYLVDSPESLSPVYHALKWSLPDDAALVVVPVDRRPKSRGLAPGATSWLRERVQPTTAAGGRRPSDPGPGARAGARRPR